MNKVTKDFDGIDKDKTRQHFRKQKIGSSRFLDNYFHPFIHNKAFWPNGLYITKKDYLYSEVGLAYNYEKNNVLNRLEVNPQTARVEKTNLTRHFVEFDFVKEDEYVISIEYCSNCADHQTHVRHTAELYHTFAVGLQKSFIKRFPFVKVLLKPIDTVVLKKTSEATRILNQTKIINHKFNEVRIGAFEVQVCYTKQNETNVTVTPLYSKLQTGEWPSFENVLNLFAAISPLFKCRLTLFNKHSENTNDDLKNIKMRLSRYDDPSVSEQGLKAKEKLDEVFKDNKRQQPDRRNTEESLLELYSNDKGEYEFAHLPLDTYKIEVLPSKNYKGASAILNVNTFETGKEVKMLIGLDIQSESYVEVHLIQFIDKDKFDAVHLKEGEVSLRRCQEEHNFIHSDGETKVKLKENVDGGIFEAIVVPGRYVLQAVKKGYGTIHREITLVPGDNKINLELMFEVKYKLKISVFNFENYQNDQYDPIPSCLIKIFTNEPITEGITDKKGEYITESTSNSEMMTIVVEKLGYLPSQRTFIRTNGVNIEEEAIVIMLVKETYIHQSDSVIILTYSNLHSDNFKPYLQFSEKSNTKLINHLVKSYTDVSCYDSQTQNGVLATFIRYRKLIL